MKMSFVDDVFGQQFGQQKSEINDRVFKALRSDNWLNVYSLWEHDIQVRYYLEESYPDIAAKCQKVYDAHSELIATIGECFRPTPGVGVEF